MKCKAQITRCASTINSYNPFMHELISAQFPNRFLWTPFLLAFGAALYFAGPNEPTLAYPGIVALLTGLIVVVRRPNTVLTGIMLMIFGFFYAAFYTNAIDTPGLRRTLHDIDISGRVTKIDHTPDKTRVYLDIAANQINSDYDINRRATVRINIDANDVHVGDTLTARATLFRPTPASAPETFDYARWAYFNRLTATGYASDYSVTSGNRHNINSLRERMHNAANSFLTDGLVLGYKSALPDDQRDIWTAAGVGHVWSISGFHMTLVAGWLFALFYTVMRSIPAITRRIPARIPALMCAWVGLTFYLFLSGVGVATIRAFLMTTLGFAAVAIGREALSMRNVCLAMILIFLINPHYVMQPGFQLSFSAIFGLIWYFGDATPYRRHTRIERIRRAIYATIMTSVIATIFTAPFVAAHFYAMPTYSLLGNLVLLPIFSIAIMPLVMIGTFTALAGWTGPIVLAKWIYDFTLATATKIAALPAAVILVPHIPNTAMVFMIVGLVAIMFIRPAPDARGVMRRINYFIGVALISVGILITTIHPRPAFYVTADHELIAFQGADGKLEFNKARASNHFFTFDTWKQINREPVGTDNRRRKCPNGLCIIDTERFRVAYVQKFVPTMKNIASLCRDSSIDYIVTYFYVDAPACNHKILRGGFVINPDGRVRHWPMRRRWHNPRA